MFVVFVCRRTKDVFFRYIQAVSQGILALQIFRQFRTYIVSVTNNTLTSFQLHEETDESAFDSMNNDA